MDIASLSVCYEDGYGNQYWSGLHILQADFVEIPYPAAGFSEGKALHSGTMMHFAQNLKEIGELYYSNKTNFFLKFALIRPERYNNQR